MKLLLQFPTLGRPNKFLYCLDKYIKMSSGKNELEFNINCDFTDNSMNNDEIINLLKSIHKDHDYIKINTHFDLNTTKISSINEHIEGIDFDIVVCLSDDMIPVKEKWDHIISSKMSEYFPDTCGCLHFNDGYTENKLITLSILGKKLYEHFGYIHHPDYKVLYCDDEFTQEVKKLNKVAYFDDVIISHEHYSRPNNINSGQYDYAAKKTIYYSGRDGFVFQKRQEMGFPRYRITND